MQLESMDSPMLGQQQHLPKDTHPSIHDAMIDDLVPRGKEKEDWATGVLLSAEMLGAVVEAGSELAGEAGAVAATECIVAILTMILTAIL